MIPPYITKLILVELIPPVIEGIKEGYDYLFGDDEPKRKTPDRTRITQEDYDFIMKARATQLETGETADTLCKYINHELGMNKSKSTLSRIYNNKVDRDSLPKRKSNETIRRT